MARTKGSANLAASLEILAEAPVDARTVVNEVSDLTVASNFPYAYVGMPVYVKAAQKMYVLSATPVTTSANWKEIGSGSGGSVVTVTQIKSSGEKIATITVDGVATDIYASEGGGGGGIPLADVTGATATVTKEVASLKWTDPNDIVVEGMTLTRWSGTKVVRKAGSAPTDVSDGTVVADVKVRNQYSSSPLTDSNATYGSVWYYRFFPYSSTGLVTDSLSVSVTPTKEVVSLPTQSGTLTYDGTSQSPTWTGYDSDELTIGGDTSGTNAGTYTTTFTPKHDYMWQNGTSTAQSVSWSIAKASLTVPTVTGSYTYDTTQKSATISAYDSNLIAVSGDTSATNAGTYTVYFDLVDSVNSSWSDDSITQKSGTWGIAKASGNISLSANTVVLDDEHTSATITILDSTGAISSVNSADSTVVTATLSGDTITINYVRRTNANTNIVVNVDGNSNYESTSATIIATSSFLKVYGAEWSGDGTSTVLTRTDNAASFIDPVPYYSNMSGNPSSPFDDIMPWKGMEIVEDADAGTLVKIPKFYYKWTRNGASMKLQIMNELVDGFHVSPAHANRGDGEGERDYVYIGRYHCGATTYKSTTGVIPENSKTMSSFRSSIHSLGSDIWQNDFAMRWTIMMLYLVEFADWDSQKTIGYGCSSAGSNGPETMGATDNMPYHTGTNVSGRTTYGHTQYRHIEDLWGNVFDYMDGMYFAGTSNTDIYCIKNPSDFSDNSNGVYIGAKRTLNSDFISGFNEPNVAGYEYALYPLSTRSSTTYIGDYTHNSNTRTLCNMGASWERGVESGLFYFSGTIDASAAYRSYGSRLMKLPSNS